MKEGDEVLVQHIEKYLWQSGLKPFLQNLKPLVSEWIHKASTFNFKNQSLLSCSPLWRTS